jgi:type I restriction enzyme S subunit
MADIISGGTPKTEISEYWNGDIPWLSVKDFSGDAKRVYSSEKSITEKGLNNSATQLLYPGDIIISARGTVGEVAQIGRAMAFNQSCYGLRAKDSYSSDFLYYVLKYQVKYLKAVANGAVFDTIVLNTFDKMKLYVPELYIQKKIAKILSAYDDLIEANNRRIELLEQTAQELYQEWFVRFRFPEHEKVKFENGLPEGWSYIRFGKAIDIIDGDRGLNYPKQEDFFSKGECLFLNAGNVTSKGFDFSSCCYITKEKDTILRKGKLQHGDVVLTTRGTVGNTAYFNDMMTFSEMRINSGMVILRNTGIISPEYIYSSLKHEYLQKLMLMYASGSAQPQLPIKDMKRMKIIKCDSRTMDCFTERSSDIYNQISLLIVKNQTLIEQRDMLLPHLMSGKLEV